MKTLDSFKNSIYSFFKKIWKKIDKDDVLTEVESLAFEIFKISLYDEKNVRFLSPNGSTKRYILSKTYITDKDINTFIVFDFNKLCIINHKYKYEISMPLRTCDIMAKMFDDKVEKEREEMEKEIMSNITESLEIVLNNLKEKMKNN